MKDIEIMYVKVLWKWNGIITIITSNMNPSKTLTLLLCSRTGKAEGDFSGLEIRVLNGTAKSGFHRSLSLCLENPWETFLCSLQPWCFQLPQQLDVPRGVSVHFTYSW